MATPFSVPRPQGAVEQAKRASIGALNWNLVGAWIITTAVVIFALGGAWDIQWHVAVGRDRTFTAPHLMILFGIALAGLASLAWVLGHTLYARRNGPGAQQSRILGVFYAPHGFVLAGVGALLGTIAFPLDDYWHTLYGIDVTLWAPFHVMIISSMITTAFGSLVVIAAELPGTTGRRRLLVQISIAATLATMLVVLLVFLLEANAEYGLAQIGSYQVALYPILLACGLPLGLLPAIQLTRRPGMVTLMALFFLAQRQLMFWFTPWAVEMTVIAEGLSYRSRPFTIIAAFALPTAILGAALLVDLSYWLIQRRKAPAWLLLVSGWLGAIGVTFWDQPWAITLPRRYYPNLDVQAVFAQSLPLVAMSALCGLGLALLLSRSLLLQPTGGDDA
jgi:hypothetical protein